MGTYRGHRQPDRQGARTVGNTVHTEGNGNQLGEGTLGTEGTDNHTYRGAHTVGHTGALSTIHTEDTDNQAERGPLGHCLLNI